jgi:hypothetical protein
LKSVAIANVEEMNESSDIDREDASSDEFSSDSDSTNTDVDELDCES